MTQETKKKKRTFIRFFFSKQGLLLRCASINPLNNDVQLVRREIGEVLFALNLHQQAIGTIARYDDRAILATFNRIGIGQEAQSGCWIRSMTCGATRSKERTDVIIKRRIRRNSGRRNGSGLGNLSLENLPQFGGIKPGKSEN